MNTEDGNHSLEKRKFFRVREDMLMLYSLAADPYTEFKAIVCDISAGGLRFATEMSIVPQTKLILEVFHALSYDKTTIFSIPVKAQTVWIRKIIKEKPCCEGENFYEVGAKVVEIREEDRRRIAQYAEEVTP